MQTNSRFISGDVATAAGHIPDLPWVARRPGRARPDPFGLGIQLDRAA